VSLTTPRGSTIVLHDRAGARTTNLVQSYRSTETPALAAIADQPAQGNWTLKVADLAAQDTGTLRRWSLDIGLKLDSQVVRWEATPVLTIPDNDPQGVSTDIVINQTGTAKQIQVSLDLTHSYIGDLRVELSAPSGQKVTLHDRAGGSQDKLIKTYDSSAHLASFIGQPIQGSWVLKVMDLSGQDVGKLNKWSLDITF
jgi:subtilisin-like proprotein convertase family protein